MTSPYWTVADQAELTVLVHEFVDGYYEHKERCSICCAGGAWCRPLTEALQIIEDWRVRRLAYSRALVLRRRQLEIEEEFARVA